MKQSPSHAATLLATALCALTGLGMAQQDRSIKSEDFVKNRPVVGNKPAPRTRYRQKATEPMIARRKSAPPKVATTTPTDTTPQMVGVTLWRMRKMRPDEDPRQGLLVQNLDGKRERQVPVRSSLSRPLQINDVIRLTVEAQRAGYLYIIDSEMRRDGTVGNPTLIFPDSANVDNSIRPGMLVDFPDRTEQLPYFRITTDNPNYAGELLTVIISPKPLKEWDLDRDQGIGNLDFLARLEERSPEATRFESEDGEDTPETPDESETTAGNKSRRLVRDDPNKYRTLTRDKPLPQTVYETRTSPDDLVVVPIRLPVGQSRAPHTPK